ncbi:Aste57867_20628 [Aphanomyces stellatus]|uniref:WD40 repeat-containing protein SMU1 n=1 Tax=Aphanomyces stellatus TaxID=120398 RepID=A0A485LFI5_9STRA|nr:hypothetical protein As57867_020560 [Aphanomyces stellatus]VFT97308.1 Aste57867_20628 [Aphanomyces stellatus]
MAMEIASEDVIRLIQQFLREHKLFDTLHTLQEESQVTMQAVDSVDALANDIMNGKWDQVLTQTQHLHLSTSFMIDLYEQIVLELTEGNEGSVARELLHQAPPMRALQERDITRFGHLERVTGLPSFDARFAYSGVPKDKRREELAKKLRKYVTSAPPSRLLTLLGQALKFQQLSGVLPAEIDLFQNAPKRLKVDRTEESIQKPSGKIKFGKASTPQTAQFSMDGRMLVSGTKDGFVEAWDFDKCVLKKDLDYQARDEFMMHEESVTAQAFSRDGELLATASVEGKIKVWKLSSGQCLRRFEHAHSKSIHSICFSKDGTQLLTASFDQLVRLHGLKSGQTLKEFHGHDNYVNFATFSPDMTKVLSTSCDGTIKIWDVKSAECLSTLRPPHAAPGVEMDVLAAHPVPGKPHLVLLVTRSKAMYLLSWQGEFEKTTYADPYGDIEPKGEFVAAATSPQGKYLYGLTDKGFVLVFKMETGVLEHAMQVSTGTVYGIAHHPHRNVLATFGNDGYVRVWKA